MKMAFIVHNEYFIPRVMQVLKDAGSARRWAALFAAAAVSAMACGAEDPAARALQQNQLQRQQQQDALQLRMQQQNATQNLPADTRRQPALEQLQVDQRQQQQQLHYRQTIEPGTAQPSDDEAGRRAKAQMELHKAQEQSQRQLRRFESELRRAPAPLEPPPKLD